MPKHARFYFRGNAGTIYKSDHIILNYFSQHFEPLLKICTFCFAQIIEKDINVINILSYAI